MNNPSLPGGFNAYGNQGQGYGHPQNMRLQSNIPTPNFQNMMPQTEYQPRMSVYNMPQQDFGDSLRNRASIGVEQWNIYRSAQVEGSPHRVIENIDYHMENRSAQVPGFIPAFDTQTRVINPINPQISPHTNQHIPHINPHLNPHINPHLPHINPQMNPSYPPQNLHASYIQFQSQSQLPNSSPSLSQRDVCIPDTIPAFDTQRHTINNSFIHNPGPIPTNLTSTHQASTVSIQKDQYNICCKCKQSTGNLISLQCPDKWCIDCLKRVCIDNSFQYALIECVCRARMKREYFINIFGGEYQLSKLEDDYYTRLNDQFKVDSSSIPVYPIQNNPIFNSYSQPSMPSYPPASNSYSQSSMPNYPPASNSYSQPSMPSYPPASDSYSQSSMPNYPPASNTYSQPPMPSYPPGSNSYSQSSALLNTSRYQPTIPSSNSIPSLYSTFHQNEYLARFICDYCKDSISDESSRITLDCDHKICKSCLNTQITIQRSISIHPTCKFDNTSISNDIISANLFPFLQTIENLRQYLPHTN